MRAILVGLLLWVGAIAWGDADAALRDRVESSLVVTGSIDVDATGEVVAHAIDQPDKLHPEVLSLIDRAIAGWQFQPALRAGQPRAMSATMRLSLVARRDDAGGVAVRIAGASFRDVGAPDTDRIRSVQRGRPLKFPDLLGRRGVSGIVYVALRIDGAGRVTDAAVRQVDLTVLAGAEDMARWRDLFARPTLRAAHYWTFEVPTTGPDAGKDHYTGLMLVRYAFGPAPAYGEWQPYVPGPRAEIAWLEDDTAASAALPAGELVRDAGVRLLTPLDDE